MMHGTSCLLIQVRWCRKTTSMGRPDKRWRFKRIFTWDGRHCYILEQTSTMIDRFPKNALALFLYGWILQVPFFSGMAMLY